MIDIKLLNIRQTFEALNGISDEKAKKSVKIVTQDVYDNVKRLASKHHQTGKMETNIKSVVKGHAGLVFIDDKNMLVDWQGRKINYSAFVLFGSKPHKIEAKNKKALMFGNFRFAKSVEHPGYKGDDFLHKGANETFKNIQRLLAGI